MVDVARIQMGDEHCIPTAVSMQDRKGPFRASGYDQLCVTKALWRSAPERKPNGEDGPEEGVTGLQEAGRMPRGRQGGPQLLGRAWAEPKH